MILNDIEKKEYELYLNRYSFVKDFRNKTFLITGAKGTLGQALIKWLLLLNLRFDANINIYASTRDIKDIPSYIDNNDNITYINFNEELNKLKDSNIDYIIHNAAPTSNKVFKEKPADSLKVILDGTRTALDLCKNQNAKMIYLSSEESYGVTNIDTPVSEEFIGSAIDSMNFRSCYPLGKKVSELLCKTYNLQYGTKVLIARPSIIFGLTQPYDNVKIESEILHCILENKNLIMKSKGLTKKSMVYTLDVVSGLFIILARGNVGEAYNITNESTFMMVKDTANTVFKKFNDKLKIEFEENDTSISQGYLPQRSLLLDTTKLRTLGWEPLADLYHIYEVDIERFKNNVR